MLRLTRLGVPAALVVAGVALLLVGGSVGTGIGIVLIGGAPIVLALNLLLRLSFADSDERDVDRAVAAAREAFPLWSTTPAEERFEFLMLLVSLIERDMDAQGQLAPGNGSESRSRTCRIVPTVAFGEKP